VSSPGGNLLSFALGDQPVIAHPCQSAEKLVPLDLEFVLVPLLPGFADDRLIVRLLAIQQQVVPGRIEGGDDLGLASVQRFHQFQHFKR
jgi:hypothetical protein